MSLTLMASSLCTGRRFSPRDTASTRFRHLLVGLAGHGLSREAFEVFAALAGAPDVLAVLELFAGQSGLRERDDFSVSCLPGNGRALKGKCRA